MHRFFYFSFIFLALTAALTLSLMAATSPATKEEDLEASLAVRGKTVLLLGVSETSYFANTVMLAHMDADGGTMKLLELSPQALTAQGVTLGELVAQGAGRAGEVSEAERLLAGVGTLRSFLEDAFGISIEGYAALTGKDLARLVDALGGVPLELPHSLAYFDEKNELSLSLKAGKTRADGEMARALVLAEGLFIREGEKTTESKSFLLTALFQKLKFHSSSAELAAFIKEALAALQTDISLGEALAIGGALLTAKNSSLLYASCPGEPARGRKVIPEVTARTAAEWLEGWYDEKNALLMPGDPALVELYKATPTEEFSPISAKRHP